MVPRWRWIARSHWLGRERKASGDISTTGKPQYIVAKQPPMRPMSWYSGSQLTNTSSVVARAPLAIARTLARRFACVSTTPFGLPVLPEVYCRNAMWPLRPRTGAKSLALPEKSSGTITARSDSTCARRRYASALASGIVTITDAPALLRMPT